MLHLFSSNEGESSGEEVTDSEEEEEEAKAGEGQPQLQQPASVSAQVEERKEDEKPDGKENSFTLDTSAKLSSNSTPVASVAAQPSSTEAPSSGEGDSAKKAPEESRGGKKETESPLPMIRKFVTHEDAKTAFKELLREKVKGWI